MEEVEADREELHGSSVHTESSLSQQKREGTVKSVHVLLPARLHRRIKHIATARDATMSALIAEVMAQWVTLQPPTSVLFADE
jgi:predicted DNA-binding ribbon-helix-helix protein